MSDLQFPSWERPLKEARESSDLEVVREKVEETETAIFFRLQELQNSSNGHHEREAIRRAARELLTIKCEKLKWPQPGSSGPADQG